MTESHGERIRSSGRVSGKGLCVNFGCGLEAPKDWLNFDASPSLRLLRVPLLGRLLRHRLPPFEAAVRYGDIVRGLPIPDCSCDCVYASHVLEHLALADLRTALRNTYRVLAPGGVCRLVVPDLEAAAAAYLRKRADSEAAIGFMRETLLGCEERTHGLLGRIRDSLGNSRHLWMWDYPGLAAELEAAGFVAVRRGVFGDSGIAAFAAVEKEARFDDAVCAHACRPPLATEGT